mmetsp:Transcript_63546/g.160340  ORF Transcript_63546/g.160340 Transcript_63546/m.160340 type:complete len:215 (-) Transcript_63546:160-804(-)
MRPSVLPSIVLLLALPCEQHRCDVSLDDLLHLHVALLTSQLDGRRAPRVRAVHICHGVQQQLADEDMPTPSRQLERRHSGVRTGLIHGQANSHKLPHDTSAPTVGGKSHGLSNRGQLGTFSHELQHPWSIVRPRCLQEAFPQLSIAPAALTYARGDLHVVIELNLLVLAECRPNLQLLQEPPSGAETVLHADHVHGRLRQVPTAVATAEPRRHD